MFFGIVEKVINECSVFPNISTRHEASLIQTYNILKKLFISLAMAADTILYLTFNREIGRQFFIYCRGFPSLGI